MKRIHFKVLFMALFTAILLASIPLFCIVSNAAYQAENNLKFLVAAEAQTEGTSVKDSIGNNEATVTKGTNGESCVSTAGIYLKKAQAQYNDSTICNLFKGSFSVELYLQNLKTNGTNDKPSCLFSAGIEGGLARFAIYIYHDSKGDHLAVQVGEDGKDTGFNRYANVFTYSSGSLDNKLITVTYQNNTLRIYVDGDYARDISSDAYVYDEFKNAAFTYFRIGDHGDWWSEATFKSVRIYDKVLAQSEIKANLAIDKALYNSRTPGILFEVNAADQTLTDTLYDSLGSRTSSQITLGDGGGSSINSNGIYMKRAEARFTDSDLLGYFHGSFSVEMYIQDFKVNGGNDPSYLFSVGPGSAQYAIYFNQNKKLCFAYNGAGISKETNFSFSENILDDFLITVTYDAYKGTLCVYVNGAKYLEETDKAKYKPFYGSLGVVKIGDNDGYWSEATFRTVRIYDSILTQSETRKNYTGYRNAYAKDKDLPKYDFGYDHEGHLKAFFGGKYSISSDATHWKNIVNDGLYANVRTTGNSYLTSDGSYKLGGNDRVELTATGSSGDAAILSNTALKNIVNNSRDADSYITGHQIEFTIELKLSDFTDVSNSSDHLFSMTDSNGSYPFVLYYQNPNLILKYEDYNNKQKTVSYNGITAAQLKDALISFTYEKSSYKVEDAVSGGAYESVCLYINGERKDESWIRDTSNNANTTMFGWEKINLGNEGDGAKASCTYQYIRLYDKVLTQEQIRQNYALDTKKFDEKEKASTKKSAYYGITGFDKIFHQSKLGSSFNIEGYDNELNNDWTMSNFKNDDLANYLYSQEGIERIRPDNVKSSAHFLDMCYASDKNENQCNDVRNKSFTKDLIKNIDFTKVDGQYKSDAHNVILFADNSFFLRSKYKCAPGAFGDDYSNSPRLMVTSDICTNSLQDVDFCGMVIDYSDEIYKKYDSSATQIYTAFDEDKNSENGYAHSALFQTGVGFNLVRKQKAGKHDSANEYHYGTAYGVDKTDYRVKVANNAISPHIPIDDNAGYVMRIFVGGTGLSNGTKDSKASAYFDINIGSIVRDPDNSINNKIMHNYTIYRNYEQWQYGDLTNSSISSNDSVYIVRFFVDKKMVAVVAMKLDENRTFANQSAEMFSVDTSTGALTCVKSTNVPTFNDWARCNNYGAEGEADGGTPSPSGNILIAVHRENRFILNNGHIADENDSTLCKVYFDNIGYMDYNDGYTEDTFSSNVVINADMTVNVKSTIAHQYPVKEPVVKFNRLAYNSSLILDAFAQGNARLYKIPYYVKNNPTLETRIEESLKFNDVNSLDYKASHGTSYLVGDRFLTEGAIRDKAIDGIYFKDICDTLTIEVVDFNGVVIYVDDNFKVYEYFKKLYDDFNGDKTLTGNMNKNQINLMIDIIELGREDHYNSGYFKASRDHMFEFTGEDDAWKNQQNLLVSAGDFQQSCDYFSAIEDATSIGNKISSQEMLDKYDKPRVTKSDSTANYSNTFKNYNISIKSYIGLVVNINFRTGGNISDYLEIIGPDDKELDILGLSDRATYNDKVKNPFYDEADGVVTVEIPLKLTDYDKVYTLKLYSTSGCTGAYQELQYSLNKYAAAMWSNSSNNIDDFVKRLYHIEVIAKHFNDDENEFVFNGIPA